MPAALGDLFKPAQPSARSLVKSGANKFLQVLTAHSDCHCRCIALLRWRAMEHG